MRNILSWVVKVLFGVLFVVAVVFLVGFRIADVNSVVETFRFLAEIVAIIVGGLWTYNRFIKTREDHPYLTIQHRIEHCSLENNFTYLSAFVTVTNEGKIKLDLGNGMIYVRKVLPLSSRIKKLIAGSDLSAIRKGENKDVGDKLFIDQSQRVGWDTLGDRTVEQNLRGKMHELEPGQTREIQFDFLFKDKVDVVEIISYFEFEKSGWEHATLHFIKERDTEVVSL